MGFGCRSWTGGGFVRCLWSGLRLDGVRTTFPTGSRRGWTGAKSEEVRREGRGREGACGLRPVPSHPRGNRVGTNQGTTGQDNDKAQRCVITPAPRPSPRTINRNAPATQYRTFVSGAPLVSDAQTNPIAILSTKLSHCTPPCAIQLSSPTPAELQSMRRSRRVNSIENPGTCRFCIPRSVQSRPVRPSPEESTPIVSEVTPRKLRARSAPRQVFTSRVPVRTWSPSQDLPHRVASMEVVYDGLADERVVR